MTMTFFSPPLLPPALADNNRCFTTLLPTVPVAPVIKIAEQNGFILTEPINFAYKGKVVHWNATSLDYTFIFFALRKNRSA